MTTTNPIDSVFDRLKKLENRAEAGDAARQARYQEVVDELLTLRIENESLKETVEKQGDLIQGLTERENRGRALRAYDVDVKQELSVFKTQLGALSQSVYRVESPFHEPPKPQPLPTADSLSGKMLAQMAKMEKGLADLEAKLEAGLKDAQKRRSFILKMHNGLAEHVVDLGETVDALKQIAESPITKAMQKSMDGIEERVMKAVRASLDDYRRRKSDQIEKTFAAKFKEEFDQCRSWMAGDVKQIVNETLAEFVESHPLFHGEILDGN